LEGGTLGRGKEPNSFFIEPNMVAEIMSDADTRANCSTLSRSGVLPLSSLKFSDIFEANPLTSCVNLFAVGRLYATGPDGIACTLSRDFSAVSKIPKPYLKLSNLVSVEQQCFVSRALMDRVAGAGLSGAKEAP
jgi:hypothetical protein